MLGVTPGAVVVRSESLFSQFLAANRISTGLARLVLDLVHYKWEMDTPMYNLGPFSGAPATTGLVKTAMRARGIRKDFIALKMVTFDVICLLRSTGGYTFLRPKSIRHPSYTLPLRRQLTSLLCHFSVSEVQSMSRHLSLAADGHSREGYVNDEHGINLKHTL